MNKLVAALGSRGWTNTLFSRPSTLKFELPTATSFTGSLNSRTLRWFWVVAKRVIFVLSAFCVSIFWPKTASTADAAMIRMRFIGIAPSFSPHDPFGEVRLHGASPWALLLVQFGFRDFRSYPGTWKLQPA